MEIGKKRVADSRVEQVHIVRPPHVNGYGRLFGGQLMQWIDETAGIVARRHAQSTVTTAAIDNLSFKSPAFQNDTVVLSACVSYVGKTSMEIRVDTFIEAIDGERSLINTAVVVMVAIEQDGTPRRVPELIRETEEEIENWNSGLKRYQLRKQRRIEGF